MSRDFDLEIYISTPCIMNIDLNSDVLFYIYIQVDKIIEIWNGLKMIAYQKRQHPDVQH